MIDPKKAKALKALVRAGFSADSAVKYIETTDAHGLKHLGVFSVQLEPPRDAKP